MDSSVDLFVPGRLSLFGEHSDWAGAFRSENPAIEPGLTLTATLPVGIGARASHSDSLSIEYDPAGPIAAPVAGITLPMTDADLGDIARGPGHWRLAVAGALVMFRAHGVGGGHIVITRSDLPSGRGLGSSAAVTLLVVRALSELHALGLSTEEATELAYRAERLTGAPCGRMDYLALSGDGLILARHDGAVSTTQSVQPGGYFHFLIVDLGHRKPTASILQKLQVAYPVPVDRLHRRLHSALGRSNRRLVERALEVIDQGDPRRLGRLMSQSQIEFQRAAFPFARSELAAPRLGSILTDPVIRRATYGGKGVGSQGDGAAQLLCSSLETRLDLARYIRDTHGFATITFDIPEISFE